MLANGWLYQVIACRVWGRSGYYQLAAHRFRDQLQDVMALIHAAPYLLRDQIVALLSISGDVQHWWHPPAGRGVRTRRSTITCGCRSHLPLRS
jgi:cellobiose phosphorylase